MASYANVSADQGADFQTILELEDVNGDPLDLTEYNLYGQIRRTYKSANAVDFTIVKSNALGGIIRVELAPEQTANMKSGRYVYDIYAFYGEPDKKIKLLEGIFEIIPSATKITE
jgi:hypothetical protein